MGFEGPFPQASVPAQVQHHDVRQHLPGEGGGGRRQGAAGQQVEGAAPGVQHHAAGLGDQQAGGGVVPNVVAGEGANRTLMG